MLSGANAVKNLVIPKMTDSCKKSPPGDADEGNLTACPFLKRYHFCTVFICTTLPAPGTPKQAFFLLPSLTPGSWLTRF